MKKKPNYYYEDIVRLNKIDLDRITITKKDFPKCSIFKVKYMIETGEKPLSIVIKNACGRFLNLGVKIFLKVDVEPTIVAIFKKIKGATSYLTISKSILI